MGPPCAYLDTNICSCYLFTHQDGNFNVTTKRQFIEIQAKSILNRVEGMPFRWSINPYRGCSNACPFCYARRTHWFLDEDGIDQWATKIFVKINAAEVLRRELARPTWKREVVALGTATDPYQAIEGKYKVTRQILESLCEYRTPVSIVTRSPMIIRDIDVLRKLARRAGVTVCVSIATTDLDIAREIEPAVAPPAQRLRTVKALSSAGIRTGVLLAPILPGITDDPKSLEAVVEAAQNYHAHFVWHNVLHLGNVTRDSFMRYLREHRPDLLGLYGQMYRGKYAPQAYRTRISGLVAVHKSRHEIAEPRYIEPPREPEQISLLNTAG